MRIKSQWRDAGGNITKTEYYTDAELAAINDEQDYHDALNVCLENRRMAYLEKGWHSEFDIIDDITKRGVEAVIADRISIKEQFPKPEKTEL